MQASASVTEPFRCFAPSRDANDDFGPYADPRVRETMTQAVGKLFRREATCPIPLSVSATHLLNESVK
jgi:hypothetical protein